MHAIWRSEISLFVASEGPAEKRQRGAGGSKGVRPRSRTLTRRFKWPHCRGWWVVILLTTISDLKFRTCHLIDWIFKSLPWGVWDIWLLKTRWRPDYGGMWMTEKASTLSTLTLCRQWGSFEHFGSWGRWQVENGCIKNLHFCQVVTDWLIPKYLNKICLIG